MGVGGGFEEAMFLRIRDSLTCGTGLNDDTGSVPDDGAIVFARHVN